VVCAAGEVDVNDLEWDLTEAAASSVGLGERATALLATLRPWVPFDAAWMALVDTLHPHYATAAAVDLDDKVRDYLQGPVMAADIEATSTNRRQPPLSPSDLPRPCSELRTWAECLMPAGINEALAVALFEPGGRHVGFLALMYAGTRPPSRDLRVTLARAAPVMGRAMDPTRSLTTTARMVTGAHSGAVLMRDGGVEVLPGFTTHPLLRPGAALLELARAAIRAGHLSTRFLWPSEADGIAHVRVTVIAAGAITPTAHVGMVLVSPAPDLRGLTPRELQVMGYLIDGCSNQEIAHHLVLASRTVATHVEHILVKLQASSRTSAAVQAFREGLYVPAWRPPEG
jgi:DNA-binding CsgD family transcriptional regulator